MKSYSDEIGKSTSEMTKLNLNESYWMHVPITHSNNIVRQLIFCSNPTMCVEFIWDLANNIVLFSCKINLVVDSFRRETVKFLFTELNGLFQLDVTTMLIQKLCFHHVSTSLRKFLSSSHVKAVPIRNFVIY